MRLSTFSIACSLFFFGSCTISSPLEKGILHCETNEDCPASWVCSQVELACKQTKQDVQVKTNSPCFVEGETKECYQGFPHTKNIGQCKSGIQTCTEGVWTTCQGGVLPAKTEKCDGKDNNCDGSVDEDCPCQIGDRRGCYQGKTNHRNCVNGLQTCFSGTWSSCNLTKDSSTETCDGKDNDCDGKIDENIPVTPCYSGPKQTLGKGPCVAGQFFCQRGSLVCQGEVLPLQQDICGNRLDDNCNGSVDESC